MKHDKEVIRHEIEELRRYESMATGIRENAKGRALLTALDRAFQELDKLGAPRKALIFTESRRTQDYLLSLFRETPYGDEVVLFNGTNSGKDAQQIYKDWLEKHSRIGPNFRLENRRYPGSAGGALSATRAR